MKKLLSIMALSSLVVIGNVQASNGVTDPSNLGPGGTQQAQIIIGPGGTRQIIGPGGIKRQACGLGAHWCPAQNNCISTQYFTLDTCFPTGLNPKPTIGPDGVRSCLMGQLYCPADGSCRRFGNPTVRASASIINQCQIPLVPIQPMPPVYDNGSVSGSTTGYTVTTDGNLVPINNSTTGYTVTRK